MPGARSQSPSKSGDSGPGALAMEEHEGEEAAGART